MAVYNEMKCAQLGYKAYGESTGNKNFLNQQMPDWADLPDGQKKAWLAATEAIRQYFAGFLIDSHTEGKGA